MKVVLFGVGRHLLAIESFLQDDVEILFYIDNNSEKQASSRNGKKIYAMGKYPALVFDYIVITAFGYKNIEQQLLRAGYKKEMIIPFFKENLLFENYRELFKPVQSFQYSLGYRLQYRIERLEQTQSLFSGNMIYELTDQLKKGDVKLPKICTVDETCRKIVQDKVSVSRYGDGEFQIILGAAKDVYQDDDAGLAKRLVDILLSNLSGHIVALADDYGCMEGLREENKNTIRRYMTEEKRQQHYQYIDMEKQYYNAYISRPYVIYPHDEREKAYLRFLQLKKIWEGRKILFVEGESTRMGVGNDLFSNAKSIQRIIAPSKNAFSVYTELLEEIKKSEKDCLVLIALGPTATVLAYDLCKEGYWAIDIGHLDLEYEWYLKGEGYSVIPWKYNNEVAGGTIVEDISDEDYERSIIGRIEIGNAG